MIKQETFEAKQSLTLENSFGIIKEQHDITLEVTLGIRDDGYGWFEIFDVETGGDEWYAEGGIWIEGNTITDYDGVFALPQVITDKLKEWKYDVSNVEC